MKSKRLIALLLGLILCFASVSGAFAEEEKKLSIVTTIFPIYDWVREITAGQDNVDVTLLLDNGVDLHSYQPSAQDIMKISTADMFVYVGGESDGWVEDVLASPINPDLKAVNLVDAMGAEIKQEETVEGMEHEHHHEHEHSHPEKKEVPEDRSIDDYQGEWQSVYPYMAEPVFKSAAPFMAEAEGMNNEEAWDFFLKGNKTDVRNISIRGSEIEFVNENGDSCKAEYVYDGFYSDCWGETSIRYQFKKNAGDEAAPSYVQFDDHLNFPVKAEHFHIYCGEDPKAMLDIADNWPTYYPAQIDNADDMLAEFLEHYIDEHEMEGTDAHDMEVKTFEDNEVRNRSLLCWNGTWQSAYPYVLDGTLDEGFAKKAESGNMTAEEYKAYYAKGYETDIQTITINADDSTIEYTDVNGNTVKSKYVYLGYYIQNWSTGTKAAMYRFEALDKDSGAPIYVEFNDHIIAPCYGEHFHFRASNTGFDDIEDPENKWPTFYPASLDAEGMLDAFIGHGHDDTVTTADIRDRSLSEFNGSWKSLYPMLTAGELDAFCAYKADTDDDDSTTQQTMLDKYTANWNCDVVAMSVNGDEISFEFADGKTASARYEYAGYTPILNEDGTVKRVRFQFTTDSSEAPKNVQFNDHGYKPGQPEHFHIYYGNESFEELMNSSGNPYFVPADMTAAGIIQQLVGHDQGGHDHEHEHDHDHEEEEKEMDEHVWLSLKSAQKLVKAIADTLAGIDQANAEKLQANAGEYIARLDSLDKAYEQAVSEAEYKTVLFADRFPFRYMVDDYNLNYYAAFSGCSAESEASFATVVFLAQQVNGLDLPAVLTIEGANHRMAETVINTSNKKDIRILTMDSLQSVTADAVAAGLTYLGTMEKNLDVLKNALNK